MNDALYHFFPRRFESIDRGIDTLEGIFKNGLFLTKEVIEVPWKDYFGTLERKLKIEQYRFCLTAISDTEELMIHSEKFGFLSLQFNMESIMKLGGFPVFYVPSPRRQSVEREDHKGISLLYRLAEIQELLEYVATKKIIISPTIDIENALGAVRLLGNICYPTNRYVQNNTIASSYYNQREWRIIHGLTHESAEIQEVEHHYSITTFRNKPIHTLIDRVILCLNSRLEDNSKLDILEKISRVVSRHGSTASIEVFEKNKPV